MADPHSAQDESENSNPTICDTKDACPDLSQVPPAVNEAQTPPMIFSKDGLALHLGGLYCGQSAFLLCGGPSLLENDLSILGDRGILTMAVNNAAAVYRPQLWCSVDDPGNFVDAIWRDPGIWKFVPLTHMDKHFVVRTPTERLVESEEKVGDMPAVFGYRRNEEFNASRWLYEDSFNWGNHGDRIDSLGLKGSRSVLYVAIRLLFYLGVRSIYLLGCDFKMAIGQQNYAFNQHRTHASVSNNNNTYRIFNARMELLRPTFEKEGLSVYNCTNNSGLVAFPHKPFAEAVSDSVRRMPKAIQTDGMYDRKRRERDAQKLAATKARNSPSSRSQMPPFTLVAAVDEDYARRFHRAWQTWMHFKPQLRSTQVLLIHDARFKLKGSELEFLLYDLRVRTFPWYVDPAVPKRPQMLEALVKVPAREVKTPWYLKLDADTLATEFGEIASPDWFSPDQAGRLPAFISHPWGYTKPSNAIDILDNWGDTVDELRHHPRLDIPFDPAEPRVRHPRIISWCFFGNTEWTKTVAAYSPASLPVQSQDTFLFYCAARRGDHQVRVPMTQWGWRHVTRVRRFHRMASQLLRRTENQNA